MFFFNRIMIVIEKEIHFEPSSYTNNEIIIKILDKNNINDYINNYNINYIKYYCKKGAICLAAFKNNICVGYQFWTQDNNFKDLKQLELTLKDDEVYMFDFFVFPEYRGTKIPKIITRESLNYLSSNGINKIYGFYFSDNIKAAWWHKSYLKCTEIKHVKIHKVLFFEFANGRLMLNM